MKIKIEQLQPNPYRNIDAYPVEEEKVKALMASIEQTGFWDNILARQYNGEIQIAYGHHRLEALKRLKDPEFEVDIPVKELDEATMLKIMANENMEHWATTPSVTDETVRATRQFLIDHPEETEKMGFRGSTETPGKRVIAKFLGTSWNEAKVGFSLERLKWIEEDKVDKEVIYMFTTDGSARTFIEALKDEEKSGTPIPKEKQKSIAELYIKSGNKKQALKAAIDEEILVEPDMEEPKDELIKKFQSEAIQIIEGIDWLDEAITKLQSRYERKEVPEQWGEKNWHQILMDKMQEIDNQISSFLTMNNTQTLDSQDSMEDSDSVKEVFREKEVSYEILATL